MANETRSAILAAVVGVTATATVGVYLADQTSSFLAEAPWAGDWMTVTCAQDGKQAFWSVTFTQSGDSVAGRYQGTTREISHLFGNYAGKVESSRLFGTWKHTSTYGNDGGPFDVVMRPNQQMFEGTYTNAKDGVNAVWMGRRDGIQPTCR